MSKTQLKKLKRQQKQKAKMAGKSQTGEVPVALEPVQHGLGSVYHNFIIS